MDAKIGDEIIVSETGDTETVILEIKGDTHYINGCDRPLITARFDEMLYDWILSRNEITKTVTLSVIPKGLQNPLEKKFKLKYIKTIKERRS